MADSQPAGDDSVRRVGSEAIVRSDSSECVVCCCPISQRLLMPCDHYATCVKCLLMMERGNGQRQCAVCQAIPATDPILTGSSIATNYIIEVMKPHFREAGLRLLVVEGVDTKWIHDLLCYGCRVCGEKWATPIEFRRHARFHGLKVCDTCTNASRFLPSDLEYYDAAGLRRHVNQHPRCVVCREYVAFDMKELAEHTRVAHFRCDICADAGEVRWFPTSELLQLHWHEFHFACEEPGCVASGFVVFATRLELQVHQAAAHGARALIELGYEPPAKDYGEAARAEQRRLGEAARRRLRGRGGRYLGLLADVERGRLSAADFVSMLQRECGHAFEPTFCDAVTLARADVRRALFDAKFGPAGRGRRHEGVRDSADPAAPVAAVLEGDSAMESRDPSARPKGSVRKKPAKGGRRVVLADY